MPEPLLHTSISGSFAFKPEIDALHEQFRDHDVVVLEPTIGWLWLPKLIRADVRPLPNERGMSLRQIEDRFLDAVQQSDFLYAYSPSSYIGSSAALEIGFALGCEKPIFALEEPDYIELAEGDLERIIYLRDRITVASPEDAVNLYRESVAS